MDKEDKFNYKIANISCSVDEEGSNSSIKGGGEGVLIALAVLVIKFAKIAGITSTVLLEDIDTQVKELEDSGFGAGEEEN